MEPKLSSWIVHYTLHRSRCSINFQFDGRPSLADVAQTIGRAWGAASVILPNSDSAAEQDAAAQKFFDANDIADLVFMPFIERRKVGRQR